MMMDAHIKEWKIQQKKLYLREYYKRNSEKIKARAAAYREEHTGRVKATIQAWRDANPERRRDNCKAWSTANPERHKAITRNWKKANADRVNASCSERRARKLTATLNWEGNKEACAEIYKNCPPGYQVDHDVPLKGKLVSGLHVACNLKYLPAKENVSKKNKFDPLKYDWWPEGFERPAHAQQKAA